MRVGPAPKGLRGYGHVVLLIALGRFLAFVARMNIVPFYPELMARYSANYTETGALFSAFFVGYALSLIPAGASADHWPPRRQIGLGLLLLGVSGTSLVLAASFQLALVARTVEGIAVALVYTAILKLVAITFSRENRGKAVGLMEMATGLGMVTALSAFPVLNRWIDYRQLLFTLPVVCGAALLLLPFTQSAATPAARRLGPAPPLRSVLSWDLAHITITSLLGLFAVNGALGWIPTHLVKVLGYDRTTSGFITAVMLTFQITAVYPCGLLSDRIGRRLPVVHAGSLLLTTGFLVLLVAKGAFVYVAAALLGIGMAWGVTPLMVLTTELFGTEHAGLISAFTVAVAQAGSGLAGVVFGWVLDRTGTFTAVWIVAAAMSAVRLLTARLIREEKAGLRRAIG